MTHRAIIEPHVAATRERIAALLGIHAVIAVDVLQLKLLASTHPDEPVAPELVAPEALHILERQFGRPACGWTNASTMRAIARMGGYLGRRHGRPARLVEHLARLVAVGVYA